MALLASLIVGITVEVDGPELVEIVGITIAGTVPAFLPVVLRCCIAFYGVIWL